MGKNRYTANKLRNINLSRTYQKLRQQTEQCIIAFTITVIIITAIITAIITIIITVIITIIITVIITIITITTSLSISMQCAAPPALVANNH